MSGMKKKFSVTGMMCAACAAGIERAVKKLDGVERCEVSLMGECMDVTFDGEKVTPQRIAETVASLGYRAYDYGKVPEKRKFGLTLLVRFVVSLAFLLPLLYLSMGGMLGAPVPDGWLNYGFQLGLTTVILAINYKFFTSGVRALFHGMPNMDTLITLGSATSYLYSVVMLILYGTGSVGAEGVRLFFESAAMIVTLVCLGKFLEDKSKKRTGKELEKLSRLAPETVRVERSGSEEEIPMSEVEVGDLVIVKQGERVAVDGVVVSGHAFADASAVTGESLPVEVGKDCRVLSASLITDGYLKLRAEKVGEDTMLAGIIRLVKEAGASKAPIQKLADKISAIFVPVVTLLALITFIIWICVTKDFATAINYGVCVLVISCPCALGLATPVAIMASTGRGAGMGVLFKSADAIERLAQVRTVLLDKTATITEGKPKTVYFEAKSENGVGEVEAKRIAYALETKLNHPLARCIVEFCEAGYEGENVTYLAGMGATGEVSGKKYMLGNVRMAERFGIEVDRTRLDALAAEGKTVLLLFDESALIAVFGLADTLKEGSRDAVQSLIAEGCAPAMLTGDNAACAGYIAREAGFPQGEGCVFSELLPEDKLAAVKASKTAQPEGKRKLVAMVGDGINDSPALKEADVGIAMGNGTDVAIESADVVLMQGDLRLLPEAIRLARRTMRIIKQNLFWAFFYNCVAIPLAAGAVPFSPMIAAAAMSLSSLFVTCNALRLVRSGKKKGRAKDKKASPRA